MITDCPNCSWLFDTGKSAGETACCPFCKASFVIDESPFSQLDKFLRGKFLVRNNLRKDFSGWIYHRIINGQIGEIHKLACLFMSAIKSKYILETLWNLNFRQFLNLSDQAAAEFLACWIFSALPSSQYYYPNVPKIEMQSIFSESLWNHSMAFQPEFFNENTAVVKLENNPIFDWGKDAPLPMRRFLMAAICSADLYGGIELGKYCSMAQYSAVDRGYPAQKLVGSHVFCKSEDEPRKYEIHPTLEAYAEEMVEQCAEVRELVSVFADKVMIGNHTVSSFLTYAESMTTMLDEYFNGMKRSRLFPAWKFRARCPKHQYLEGKIFLKTDPIWRKIFPFNDGECLCHVENIHKITNLSRSEDINLEAVNSVDPVEIVESWQNDPNPLIPLPKEDPAQ